MKTIKIFLASSEELDYDRMAFGNLVRRLDDAYEKRGIRIKLFEWEDYDSAFNDRRKQDEYNDYVRDSDIFLALFHKKAGKFTIEEFDVASEEFKTKALPKVYTYCKDLQTGEEESPELAEFKKRLFGELGHYWCRYDTRESLQLQFVMQLQLVENSHSDALKVENGEVSLDGLHIASMDKLKFAAANEDYARMQADIIELHDEIEEKQLKLEKKKNKLERKKLAMEDNPDDEDAREEYEEAKTDVDELVDELQPKLNKYNKLKEEFAEYQKLLFNTAKRVAQLQSERITERMHRAMDAFHEGKVHEANIILDEAERDADRIIEDIRQSKQLGLKSIDELLLKTKTMMADATLPIEERIARTESLYEKADTLAAETGYDKEKYAELLMDYGSFLCDYAKLEKAIEIYQRLVEMNEIGEKKLSAAYNNLGLVYSRMGEYSEALDFYQKSMELEDESSVAMATNYNNIGDVLMEQGDYQNASEYLLKALEIRSKVLGPTNIETALSYNNMGCLCCYLGDYEKGLEYFEKYLSITTTLYGEDSVDMAVAYNNIGGVLDKQGKEEEASEYYFKALGIQEKIRGCTHDDTAISYNNIGLYFLKFGEEEKALTYLAKAKKAYELNHIQTKVADICSKMVDVYMRMDDRENAILSFGQAGSIYKGLAENYIKANKLQDALDCQLNMLDLCTQYIGMHSQLTAEAYNNVGAVYRDLGQYAKALEHIGKALEIAKELEDHQLMAALNNRLGRVYALMGDTNAACEHFQQAIDLQPEDHPESVDSKERIENLKR